MPLVTLQAVPAGFPSPADDYMEKVLSLDEHLITAPSATYMARVSGDSMKGHGIFNGDLLIVDRSLEPRHGDIVIVAMNGEMTCKQIDLMNRQLLSANPDYPPIPIRDDYDVLVEGVVKASIRYHR